MLKKIIAALIVVSVLGLGGMLAGCKQNELKVHEQTETVHTETHEVVE